MSVRPQVSLFYARRKDMPPACGTFDKDTRLKRRENGVVLARCQEMTRTMSRTKGARVREQQRGVYVERAQSPSSLSPRERLLPDARPRRDGYRHVARR